MAVAVAVVVADSSAISLPFMICIMSIEFSRCESAQYHHQYQKNKHSPTNPYAMK